MILHDDVIAQSVREGVSILKLTLYFTDEIKIYVENDKSELFCGKTNCLVMYRSCIEKALVNLKNRMNTRSFSEASLRGHRFLPTG